MANPNVKIDEIELYNQAATVSEAAGFFLQSYVVGFDSSTIPFKSNMESSFGQAGDSRNIFGDLLLAETEHMKQIGEDFVQYDEMMSDMISAGLVKG